MIIPPIDPKLRVVRDGLVYWVDASIQTSYPLTGSVLTDISGQPKRSLLLNNGAVYNSLNGGCIYFDGSNDFGSITNINPTNPPPWALHHSSSTGLTLCVWLRFNTVVRSLDGGIGYGDFFGNYASGHYQWQFIKDITGSPSQYYVAFQVAGPGGGYGVNILHTDFTLTANTWNYWVFTYDKTSHDVKAYINGNAISVTPYTFGTVPPTYSAPVHNNTSVGGRAGSGTRYPILGYMGDLLLYNRAITATEVTHNYEMTKRRYL